MKRFLMFFLILISSCVETPEDYIKRTSKEFIEAILKKDYKKAESYISEEYYKYSSNSKEDVTYYFDFIVSEIGMQNPKFFQPEFENSNTTIKYHLNNDRFFIIDYANKKLIYFYLI